MEGTKFIVIFSNNDIYKEVELAHDMKLFKAGTTTESEIRFNKESFSADFQILFINTNGMWSVVSDETTYFSCIGESTNKTFTNKELMHGDEFYVNYYLTNKSAIKVEFKIDFNYDKKKYDMQIDVRNITNIRIGAGKNNNVCIMDDILGKDSITLTKDGDRYFVVDNNTRYGLFVNGNRVMKYQQINDTDFFSIAKYSFYLKNGILYTSKEKNVFLNGILRADFGVLKSNLEYPKFNRNTRIKSVIPTEKISILDPPTKPEKPKSNIVISLLPAVCSLALTIVMRSMMKGTAGAYIWLSVGTMAIGLVTSVISFFERGKDFKKNSAEREDKYTDYIEKKKNEIEKIRKSERELLNEKFRDMKRNIDCVNEFSGELFDRECNDEDFLVVRLGTGEVEAKRKIDYKQQEKFESEDELATCPSEIAENFKNIERAPITIDLKACNAVGVIGDRISSYEIMKNMTLDICIRQYYNDVRVFFIIDEKQRGLINWARFMPHVNNPVLNRRNIAIDEESKNTVFEYLFNEFNRRESSKNQTHIPRFVIFVFDEMGIKSHPVSKYIENASKLGATFIFFEENKEYLPLYCNQLIYAYSNNKATVTSSEDRNVYLNFNYTDIPDELASNIAFKLAPVYCEEVSLESALRKNISLYELLGIFNASELNLGDRWRKSCVDKSMAAPLGVKTKDEVVYLDLHEKAHGPHGLVAGTTGSGKSEILQSYILSAATLFHPYEVSFVIIDFKGGGMVNQFKNLPHLIGAITNIDGKEIDRSLLSIKAELVKRQTYFAQAGVNHIDKYIAKFKKGEVEAPLPHLIIIVDEFAELKAEQPEFMKELISASRIGRSLGVHLILATQKPSGQVNEQIWSNSKFKLCLKVQTKEDSNEVIKSSLAAEILEPGRAYLQVGNNEIFDLFQSAYSGCSANMVDDGSRNKEYSLAAVDFTGRRKIIFHKKNNKSDESVKTQLMAIVEYIHQYCEENNIPKLSDICLPSLPAVISFPSNECLKPRNVEMTVEIGMFDDPECQRQDMACYDIASENMIIIGSARYGKTNILQNIVRDLVTKYTPDEVNIYIIDFASMVLKNFEGLAHVGGVVTASEDEKLINLMKMLDKEIVERKERMISVGVSSFVSYKEAGYTDYPQIVLIIDNITVLRELYFQDDTQLLSLCRESLSVGISIIVANASSSGFGYRYFSNFSRRIALFCNDSGEYSSVFDYCKMKPEDKPGRFIMEIDKRHIECQAYLAFSGNKEIERVNEMKQFIAQINDMCADRRAKMIPVIPKMLNNKYVEQNLAHYAKKPYQYIVGLDYGSVMPYVINLSNMKPLAIIGRDGAGKSNFIRNLVYTMDKIYSERLDVYIIDGINRKLKELDRLDSVKSYSVGMTKTEEVLDNVVSILRTRYDRFATQECDIDSMGLVLLVINDLSVLESVSEDRNLLGIYNEINGKYKNMGIFTMVGGIENTSISYSAPDIIKGFRDNKNIMFFEDMSSIKIIDMPIAVQRKFSKPIENGDAYYITENECIKIKTVLRAHTADNN